MYERRYKCEKKNDNICEISIFNACNKLKFYLRLLNLFRLDILAILPYYMGLLISDPSKNSEVSKEVRKSSHTCSMGRIYRSFLPYYTHVSLSFMAFCYMSVLFLLFIKTNYMQVQYMIQIIELEVAGIQFHLECYSLLYQQQLLRIIIIQRTFKTGEYTFLEGSFYADPLRASVGRSVVSVFEFHKEL